MFPKYYVRVGCLFRPVLPPYPFAMIFLFLSIHLCDASLFICIAFALSESSLSKNCITSSIFSFSLTAYSILFFRRFQTYTDTDAHGICHSNSFLLLLRRDDHSFILGPNTMAFSCLLSLFPNRNHHTVPNSILSAANLVRFHSP